MGDRPPFGPPAGNLPQHALPRRSPTRPRALAETVATFRRWLHLDDPAPVYVLAAAIVANLAEGDPVWLLIVSAPATGKTELVSAAAGLPYVHSVATITEPALLSGSPKRERAKDATGGVLRQIDEFGILLAKDFTSVLAQNRDTRDRALAALREISDGKWDRPIGNDGGRVLHWSGKCGFIGGVTPALDGYHRVISQLGDRFLLLRLPDVDPGQAGVMALGHRGREKTMRAELADALAGLVEHTDNAKVNRELDDDERTRLIQLATFTARGRTGVDRDSYTKEVTYLPQVEGVGRLVIAYARLFGGLEAIGADSDTTWSILARIAVDCLPAIRAQIIPVLLAGKNPRLDGADPVRTSDVAEQLGMATKNVRPHLEDLTLLGLATRTKTSDADNAADLWTPTDWLQRHWPPESST
jgi:hypothetical protein